MFRFRQFTIHQDQCAMKVGIDGVLLGAWAEGGRRILDVGSGTGVIALMMAQRYAEARVTAVDIDEGAARQSRQNAAASPFAQRVEVVCASVQDFARDEGNAGRFDAVVSNPPFFIGSLRNPDALRTLARHADTLTYDDLLRSAARLLTEEGTVSVVVPFDYRRRMDDAAVLAGLFPHRVCAVRTKEGKPPRRYLLAYAKTPRPLLREELTVGSAEYQRLTADFYL